jgi:hypothetical protein
MNASRIGSTLVRILLRAENIPPVKLIIHPGWKVPGTSSF